MTNHKYDRPEYENAANLRAELIQEAKRFATLLENSSTPMVEIDSAIEELRPIRMMIHQIDYSKIEDHL